MKTKIVSLILLNFIMPLQNAYGQGTTSNISGVIQSPSMNEPYGINDTSILESQEAFSSRHHRLGQNTGIGSSFLQTTSPTSESSPALKAAPVPISHHLPQLPKKPVSIYGNVENTPALTETIQEFSSASTQPKQVSPALTNPSTQSSFTTSALTKKPVTITEPLQQLNLHRTGGSSTIQY